VELDSEAERVLEVLEEDVDWALAGPTATIATPHKSNTRRRSDIQWGDDMS
jgi:hypothetical protein